MGNGQQAQWETETNDAARMGLHGHPKPKGRKWENVLRNAR